MATLTREITIPAAARDVWSLLRDPGRPDLAFPGVLTAADLEGDIRTVEFSNGSVVRERVVTVDDEARRIAYGVIEGRFTYNSSSMQCFDAGEGCRFVWTIDFLPASAASVLEPLMDAGCRALAQSASALRSGAAR